MIKNINLTPWQWARGHLGGGVLIHQLGAGRWQSWVHPSWMPGLMAKAVLCLGHKNQNKSSQIQAAWEEKDRETCRPPTELPSSTCHRWTIDSCLPENVTQRPTSRSRLQWEPPQCASTWWTDGREIEEEDRAHHF